ncbi:MAG: polysaccharide biosynthesis protein [Oscillospiraceae bacterium]|nr:polysaccharide biosynthesis protein [Oscillospiraceae bacterium]
MAKKTEGQNYMHGAAILAAGVVIMKILGFLYKVPIANVIGDDGYSMFIATYNVYNVFLTLATAGFPVALARLIAEADAVGRKNQIRRTFTVASFTFAGIGILFTAIMFFFPNYIATDILHNPGAALSIRMMSPSVLLVCMLSAHRGYCEGHGNMIPTTVGQVLEVLVKVIVGLAAAMLVMRLNLGKNAASAAAISGVVAGSLVALIYMVVFKRRHYDRDTEPSDDIPNRCRRIFVRFIKIGIPVAAGSCVMAFLNLIDSSLCMGRLQSAAGFSLSQAQTLYGVYGEAQNLFNLPAAFITPMCISIVPAISSAIARGAHDEATAISEDSMRISTALSMPMGMGLAVLSAPIMHLLYPQAHSSGPLLLLLMGIASFFVCFVLMENAILQASGKERFPMYSMIAGSFVKIAVNWFLVANPKVNIYGAPIGTLCGYFVMGAMNFVFMCVTLDKNPRLRVIMLKPFIASAAMGGVVWAVYRVLASLIGESGRIQLLIVMCAGIAAGVIVYLAAAILLRAITKKDMELIPGGRKIAKLLHMK